MRQVFLDTETTGLSAESGDRVIEIGCIEMVGRRLTGETRHYYLNPERRNSEDAVKIHGLTDDFLADKPLFATVVDDLLEFLSGAEVVIHNAAFDIGFLNAELKRAGRPLMAEHIGSVARYVVDRGLLPADPAPVALLLEGGVSGVVVLVRGEGPPLVVKKALARLHVAGTWLAKPERALTEAAALGVVHDLTPLHTPRVVDVDPGRLTFTMTAAPASWRSWKEVLLSGECTDEQIEDTARCLGTVLGTWHRDTWHDRALAARFDDYEALEQLRVAPFHRVVADARPDLAPVLRACAEELLNSRECLVHGDYSPKNVLVGDGLWVLDLEVAHVGAAVFDLAFMQSHLMLKAVHLPHRAAVLARSAAALMAEYRSVMGERRPAGSLAHHSACLLLARVAGLSPAGYLSPAAAVIVAGVATSALLTGDITVDALWELITDRASHLLTAPNSGKAPS